MVHRTRTSLLTAGLFITLVKCVPTGASRGLLSVASSFVDSWPGGMDSRRTVKRYDFDYNEGDSSQTLPCLSSIRNHDLPCTVPAVLCGGETRNWNCKWPDGDYAQSIGVVWFVYGGIPLLLVVATYLSLFVSRWCICLFGASWTYLCGGEVPSTSAPTPPRAEVAAAESQSLVAGAAKRVHAV